MLLSDVVSVMSLLKVYYDFLFLSLFLLINTFSPLPSLPPSSPSPLSFLSTLHPSFLFFPFSVPSFLSSPFSLTFSLFFFPPPAFLPQVASCQMLGHRERESSHAHAVNIDFLALMSMLRLCTKTPPSKEKPHYSKRDGTAPRRELTNDAGRARHSALPQSLTHKCWRYLSPQENRWDFQQHLWVS